MVFKHQKWPEKWREFFTNKHVGIQYQSAGSVWNKPVTSPQSRIHCKSIVPAVYGGSQKWEYPYKSSILKRHFHYKPGILGIPHLWTPAHQFLFKFQNVSALFKNEYGKWLELLRFPIEYFAIPYVPIHFQYVQSIPRAMDPVLLAICSPCF